VQEVTVILAIVTACRVPGASAALDAWKDSYPRQSLRNVLTHGAVSAVNILAAYWLLRGAWALVWLLASFAAAVAADLWQQATGAKLWVWITEAATAVAVAALQRSVPILVSFLLHCLLLITTLVRVKQAGLVVAKRSP
jgi:hypothetical protein